MAWAPIERRERAAARHEPVRHTRARHDRCSAFAPRRSAIEDASRVCAALRGGPMGGVEPVIAAARSIDVPNGRDLIPEPMLVLLLEDDPSDAELLELRLTNESSVPEQSRIQLLHAHSAEAART